MILAAVKSIAAALGQAATHAPHPMQAAPSKAVSAESFGSEYCWLRARRGGGADKSASLNDAVEGRAVHHQVAQDREGSRAPRLKRQRVAVLEKNALKAGKQWCRDGRHGRRH